MAKKRKQNRWTNGRREKAMRKRGLAPWCPACNEVYDTQRTKRS